MSSTAMLSGRMGTGVLTDGVVAVPSYPDGIVASDGRFELSYVELDRWSNRLARMLLRRGAGQGCLVGLAAVPEFETVAVRHALAKIGSASVRVEAGVFLPATTVGVTVHARREELSDSVRWLVLDDGATLREYLSTSGAALTTVEIGGGRRAS
ncbi:AMP-binding protein [Nocardia concava]|uniref:AMP-binding protein n=1 Tax=Nocardia concava TaxID=257281 RepID=UPI0012F70A64|nr:AMP-binding protein [Nocardia concava]